MEDDKKMEVATFKFGIIADFVTGVHLNYGEKEKLLREKSLKEYEIPFSGRGKVAKSTIKKWILEYKRAGRRIEGLFPKDRKDRGQFRALSPSLQMAILEIKREKKELTGVNVITELKHRKIISLHEEINLSVLYRFLESKKEEIQSHVVVDRRKFEASAPNELWQSDVLHGPKVWVDGKHKKAYLIAIIDDHSRLIIHAQFYLTERLIDFKHCLKVALEKRGLPLKLYIDNGACYSALNVEQVAACLGIGIVHTPPYTPQGRGKIERWFLTVRTGFLQMVSSVMTLDKLNEEFDDWVEQYNNRKHSSIDMTPIEKFQQNMKCTRPAPKDLMNYFRFCEYRTVKKDRTFRLNGEIYEAPVSLIDKRVEVKYHRESPEVAEVFFEGKSFGNATMYNPHVNFKLGRNNKLKPSSENNQLQSGSLFSPGGENV